MDSGNTWNKEMTHEFSPYKQIMWPMGSWPLDSKNFAKLRALFVTVMMVIMIAHLSVEIGYHDSTDSNLNLVIDHFLIIACGALTIIKISSIRLHRNDLLNYMRNAANDWIYVAQQNHREVMLRYANWGRFVFFFQICLVYIITITIIVQSLLSFVTTVSLQNVTLSIKPEEAEEEMRVITLPQEMICPFNTQIACFGIYIVQIVQFMSTNMGNIGSDVFFFGICMHLCGQLEILGLELLRFHEGKKNDSWSRTKIVTLVERHCLLLNLAKDIINTLDVILIVQLIFHALLICLIGLQFITSLAAYDFIFVARSLMSFVILMNQLFLYTYIGEILSSRTQAISTAIYLSECYGYYFDPMASERWKNDLAYAMTPFKYLTWPIGIWPLQVYNTNSLIRCILATSCMSIIVILPSMEFQMGCTDAEQNIDSLMLICCGVLGMLKTVCFRIYANNLTNNYGSAVNDYLTIENMKHRAIMRKHALVGRILSCFMVCFSYVSVLIYSLIPLLGDEQNDAVNETNEEMILEYPVPSRCALQYLNAPISMYEIYCFVEFIMLILTCTCNHGNDSLFLNITLHVCGQVKILKANFVDFDVRSPHVHDRFNALIQRHNYLIELAKKLADSISFVLLTQLFISSILLCIMGFEFILALKINDAVVMGKSLMVLCTFLTQLTVYSFVGDYLKSQMEEVGLFSYQNTWYNLPKKMMKNLIFIIMQAHYPVKLQAGNFIIVNLATYMSILKTSISYLSVLRVMVETTLMQMLGIWPLQKNTMSTMMQWSLTTILQFTLFIFLYLDFTGSYRDAGASIECILVFMCTLAAVLKHICITVSRSKLAKNINAAISDWLSVKSDERSYKIMKEHAHKSGLFTVIVTYTSYISTASYVLAVVLMNYKKIFLFDTNRSNGTSNESYVTFVIPSGWLGEKITSSQYAMLIILQTVQLTVTCTTLCITDSFYISIIMHLTGQLKVLKTKFQTFASKPNTEVNHRKQLISLINRHCELTELNQNIEDAFHLIILFQLIIATLLLALLGLRILFCLKNNYYVELTKSGFTLNYVFMESLVYSYGGDFVQKGSDEIFHAMFMISWFTLPTALMKDLHFVMMRSSYPFRLTGGKFFYASRETVVNVFKMSASYISVLRIALQD